MQPPISNKIKFGDTLNPAKDYGGVPLNLRIPLILQKIMEVSLQLMMREIKKI